MYIAQLNQLLQNTTEHSIETSFQIADALLQIIGIQPLAKKQVFPNATITLNNLIVENPIVKNQPLFYVISSPSQAINCRLAVVKKINKQTIYRVVHENKFDSWQANIGIPGTDNLPYTIDFITNKNYQQLTVVFSQGEQIRTLNFTNKLTNLQVNKILPKWLNIAQQPKAIINADLWSSLDVKQVNKAFYITIKDRFDTLISNIQVQHPTTQPNQQKMFAIKLIGRYLFCWFLKEKEIIPAQALSSASLGKHSNIYNQIINPLFFITLNTLPQPEREYPSFVPQDFIKLFANIPYLNGGLFEESEEDKLINTLQIDTWLLQFIQFLEEYNFTVDESSPNYEQLAIDPEMLGRILENLLASLNTETEKMANDRKSLGAFYTPRVIVDYMVTESLKYYLLGKLLPNNEANEPVNNNTDLFTTTSSKTPNLFAAQEPQQLAFNIDKLTRVEDTKVPYIKAKIDKLFNVWDDTNPFTKTETQIVKEALQQCKIIDPACGSGAFPMGILHKLEMLNEKLGTDKSAYKLRRHILSQNIYGVDILPIAVEISRLRAWLSLILVSDFKPTDRKHNFGIEALPNLDFKFVCANALISNGYDEFIALAKQSQIPTLIRLNTEIEYLEDIRNQYFNSSNTDNKKRELIQSFEAKKDYIKQNFRLQKDKLNINDFLDKIDDWNPFNDSKASSFFSPAWMLGITDGFDVVIGNPPYVQVEKGFFSRDSFPYSEGKDKGKQNLYKVFTEFSFNTLKNTGVATMIVQSSLMCDLSAQFTRELLLTKTQLIHLIEFPKKSNDKESQVFSSVLQGTCVFTFLKKLPKGKQKFSVSIDNDTKTILNPSFENLVQKKLFEYYPNGFFIPLIKKSEFGLIEKMNINTQKLKDITEDITQGDLNVSTEKTFFSEQITICKLLRGKHIHRYHIDNNCEEFIIGDYKIEKRNKNFKNQFFLCQNITGTTDTYRLHFATTDIEFNYLAGHTTNKFLLKNQKDNSLIIGILNSKLLDWYFRKTSTNNHVNNYEIEQFPIAKAKNQQPLINLVNKILAAKKENPKANTIVWEREIDIRVYHLYNLTLAEAQLIDATVTEQEFEKYKN